MRAFFSWKVRYALRFCHISAVVCFRAAGMAGEGLRFCWTSGIRRVTPIEGVSPRKDISRLERDGLRTVDIAILDLGAI